MEFEKRKSATLAAIESPEPDKSPKGSIDKPIIPLLSLINSHPSYFTTSSCSGRISIFSQPLNPTKTPKKKAKGGSWLFISHDPVDPSSVLPLLFSPESRNRLTGAGDGPHGLLFKFEPLIVAVECRDVGSAQALVSLAISCGFRESGITSVSKRVIIAVRCSIRMEVPLGDTENVMVSSEFLEYLIRVGNEKMEANRKRTDAFFEALKREGFSRVGNGEVGCGDDLECPVGGKVSGLSLDEEDGDLVNERNDLDENHSGNLLP